MRKRTITQIADTVFWYIIYFLPVILWGIHLIYTVESGQAVSFTTFLSNNRFSLANANVVYTSLESLFGSSGVMPLFLSTSGSAPIFIGSWFVSTYILHLAIDFLLFIPRFAHKLMDKCVKE